jgi:hypothetical protein
MRRRWADRNAVRKFGAVGHGGIGQTDRHAPPDVKDQHQAPKGLLDAERQRPTPANRAELPAPPPTTT